MTGNNVFKTQREGSILWLSLNRPEKRNSISMEVFEGLMRVFPDLDQDPEVRAVIIKGEGKSFCAGMDLEAIGAILEGKGADHRDDLRREILRLQEAVNVIERCRKPVIAAIHGYCLGGGVDLVCGCDIRIASRDALFSVRETRMAMVPDLGTLQRLPHIVGQGWFRELALTGRDFSAEEALGMGFVTHLCEDQAALFEKAREIASQIVSCSPLAVQGVKEVICYSRDHGVHAGLSYVAQKNAVLLHSEDLMEAFRAFKEKRKPIFKGS
ncbi:MAG: crotonase/enoyl-CoA hydratase family protein [Deltaproteobacteria bacterium]|nr:crotonase/enoyl-CoA hydratase family protein [Deltaproteobacteria bacterium]